MKDTSWRTPRLSFEQDSGTQMEPVGEPARDGDLLGPSCVVPGDGAGGLLPVAAAPAAREGQCQATLTGASHAPGLIGTWCPRVTQHPPRPPHSHENPPEDAKQHGGRLPRPVSADTPSAARSEEQ